MSRRRKQKIHARALLASDELEGIIAWAEETSNPTKVLATLLFDGDPTIRWRAIEALGRVAAWQARDDLEAVRELIRYLFWSMNDESGGIIWNGPEAIAEVLAWIPPLVPEYAHRLPHFLREEPFERGAAWGIARIAELAPQSLRASLAELIPHLESPDPVIRAHVGVAIRRLDASAFRQLGAALLGDATPLEVYDPEAREVVQTTIAELVESPDDLVKCHEGPKYRRSDSNRHGVATTGF